MLYFQLVNILEQRIEEDGYLASMNHGQECDLDQDALDPFAPPLASQTAPAKGLTLVKIFYSNPPLNVDAFIDKMKDQYFFVL